MTDRIVPYDGLGFTILLVNPPMLTLPDNSEVPAPNMKVLQQVVFESLIDKPARFTGAESRFIRKYMGLKQANFARLLKLRNHSRVSQWESLDAEPTGMEDAREVLLRLRMVAYLSDSETIPIEYLDHWDKLVDRDDSWKIRVSGAA